MWASSLHHLLYSICLLAVCYQTKMNTPLSGLEQREGYLGRDDTNRHKWRLRHSLGDGFQPFEPHFVPPRARTLTTPPSQGDWEGAK